MERKPKGAGDVLSFSFMRNVLLPLLLCVCCAHLFEYSVSVRFRLRHMKSHPEHIQIACTK